jgi:hypothetical protein
VANLTPTDDCTCRHDQARTGGLFAGSRETAQTSQKASHGQETPRGVVGQQHQSEEALGDPQDEPEDVVIGAESPLLQPIGTGVDTIKMFKASTRPVPPSTGMGGEVGGRGGLRPAGPQRPEVFSSESSLSLSIVPA